MVIELLSVQVHVETRGNALPLPPPTLPGDVDVQAAVKVDAVMRQTSDVRFMRDSIRGHYDDIKTL